jgi:hypothetical protein|tara:strand:- start:60 stop:671 length:612 start_codon:yes stop_codon:yes gene_type:complete
MITSVEFGIILENINRLVGDEFGFFNKEQFQRFLNKNANLIAVGDWKMRDIEPNKFYIQYFRATDNLESIRIIGGIENGYLEGVEIFGPASPELAESISLKVDYYQLHLPAVAWPKTLLWTNSEWKVTEEFVQTTRGTFKINQERHNVAYQLDRDYGSDEVDRFKWDGWVHDVEDGVLLPFEVWELHINFGTGSIISLNYPLR